MSIFLCMSDNENNHSLQPYLYDRITCRQDRIHAECWTIMKSLTGGIQTLLVDPLNLESSTFLPDSLSCQPAVCMLGSHSELNQHFLPNRSQSEDQMKGLSSKNGNRRPSEITTHVQIRLRITAGGFHHAYHMGRGVCVNECASMCVPGGEGLLAKAGKKTLRDLFLDRLNEQLCC